MLQPVSSYRTGRVTGRDDAVPSYRLKEISMDSTKCSWNAVSRAAAAAAIASVPVSAAHAQTAIESDNLGVYTAEDLESDAINFDLNGDGFNEFSFLSFYGGDLVISPLEETDPAASVLLDGSGAVARFSTAQDVFAAAQSSDSSGADRTISNPFGDPVSLFLEPGYFGVLFDIPGGSPYIGAVQIDVDVDEFDNLTQVQLIGGSYQAVPAPSGLAVVGFAVAAGLRRRR